MYKKMTLLVFLLCFSTTLFAQYSSAFRWKIPKTGGNNWFGSYRSNNGDAVVYGDGSTVYNITQDRYYAYLQGYLQGYTKKIRVLSASQDYLGVASNNSRRFALFVKKWTSESRLYSTSESSGTVELTVFNEPFDDFALSQDNATLVGNDKITIVNPNTGDILSTTQSPNPSNPDQHFNTNFRDITITQSGRAILGGTNSTAYYTDDYSYFNPAQVGVVIEVELKEIERAYAFSALPKRRIVQSDPIFAVGNQFAPITAGVVIRSTDDGATWDSIYAVPNVTLTAISVGSNTNAIIGGYSYSGGYSGGVLYYTKDGGDTWTEGGESSNLIYSITHVSADSAYAVGQKGLILLTTDGGEHWTQISDANPGFSGIYFSSSSVGYAVTLTDLYILSVYKTTDAGESWDISYVDSSFAPSNAFLNAVFFIDDMTGFIAGSKLIKTTDGGATWNEVNTGITSNAIFQDVYFVDDNLGFAVYRDPFNGDGAIKTTNGGTTWTPLNINNDKYDKGYIYFADENLGFISGYSTLYRTTDGGENWDTLAVGTNSQDLNSKVTFINSSTGFFGKKGRVFKTTNRGDTWTDVTIDIHSVPQEIQFVSDSVGYLVCSTDTFGIPVHVIFKTVDGGNSWTDLTDRLPGTTGFQHLFFTDQTTGYLAGSAGIIKTTTGGDVPTAIKQPENPSVPSGIYLFQNFPNPFNPVTTIRYVLPRDVKVRLVIYDITGRRVRTLVNQKQTAGEYSVQWDGTNNQGQRVSSGVYFYRFSAKGFTRVNKMVYVK